MLPKMYLLLNKREVTVSNSAPHVPHEDITWMMSQIHAKADGTIKVADEDGEIRTVDTLYQAVKIINDAVAA